MTINAGCCLRMLYVNGMIMTIAAGGALRDSLASLLTKEASRLAGSMLCAKQGGVSEIDERSLAMDSRRAKEELRQAEESRSVLQMEHVAI